MRGSRPISRLRSSRTCPGISSGVRRRRRVEAEHRLPRPGLRPDREAARVGHEHGQPLGGAAHVGRDQRPEPGRGVEVDPVERATDRQPDGRRTAILDDRQSRRLGRRLLWQPGEQPSLPVDEVAPRPHAPDEDRRPLAQTHPDRVGQAHADIDRADRRDLADAVLVRPRDEAEQVRPLGVLEHVADLGLVGEGRTLDRRVDVREDRRLGDAVHRRRGDQQHEDGPGTDRCETGRCASDPACPPDRGRPERTAGGGLRWGEAAGRLSRSQRHRGRSAAPRRVAGRWAWRSMASSMTRRHTSANV